MDGRATAYLDTCIVSGLAKEDLAQEQLIALGKILRARRAGQVELVTSSVTQQEIEKVPVSFRAKHDVIFNLLCDIPVAVTHHTDAALFLLVGAGCREDPLYAKLKAILPDENDAMHTFQAAKNSIEFLITVDRRTFLTHARAVRDACGVELMTPGTFVGKVIQKP